MSEERREAEVTISYTKGTVFYFILDGKKHIGFMVGNVDVDDTIQKYLDNAWFIEMGYGSNVCYVLPKARYVPEVEVDDES